MASQVLSFLLHIGALSSVSGRAFGFFSADNKASFAPHLFFSDRFLVVGHRTAVKLPSGLLIMRVATRWNTVIL